MFFTSILLAGFLPPALIDIILDLSTNLAKRDREELFFRT